MGGRKWFARRKASDTNETAQTTPNASEPSLDGAPSLVLDPTLGDEIARSAVDAIERGDLAAVPTLLGAIDDQRHLDAVLSILTHGLPANPAWLDAWLAADPDDVTARAVQGFALVRRGWVIRSDEPTERVSQEQFDQFWRLLREADRLLEGVVADHPDTGIAWRSLIDAGRGLRIPKADLRRLYLRGDEHCPNFLPANRAYLKTTIEQWGGSLAESLEFARWVSARSADGDLAHLAVAEAYLAHLMTHPDLPPDHAIATEIRQALDRSWLGYDDWGNDPAGLLAKNVFAAVAHRLRDEEVARHMIALIGLRPDRVVAEPWRWFGDPARAFVVAGRTYGLW